MKLKCTNCGRGNINFGGTCAYCQTTNHDNTQSMDQFWGKDNARRERRASSGGSFFSPGWAIPFKLLWLPVRLVWWLVKIPF